MTGDAKRENGTLCSMLTGKQRHRCAGRPAPTDVFRGAVQAAKIGADKDIPHLSAALIDKYVSDLQLLGLVYPRG